MVKTCGEILCHPNFVLRVVVLLAGILMQALFWKDQDNPSLVELTGETKGLHLSYLTVLAILLVGIILETTLLTEIALLISTLVKLIIVLIKFIEVNEKYVEMNISFGVDDKELKELKYYTFTSVTVLSIFILLIDTMLKILTAMNKNSA